MTIEKILNAIKMKKFDIEAILLKAQNKNIICSFSKKNKFVKFPNGCSFYFEDDNWGGDNPYGVETIFINKKDVKEVLAWIQYWDDDRDEQGFILSPWKWKK